MRNEVAIKDFYGRIIGYIETLPNEDRVVRDFYRRVIGRYDKKANVTKDFYGKIVGYGDLSSLLFSLNKK